MLAALVLLAAPLDAFAQAKKFTILDNSFLVEEAFNQERGIFQNIFSWTRQEGGEWEGSFTQEWPAPAITHQLSYTVPFVGGGPSAHVGGILLNYRYQVLNEGPGHPAFAPRASVILPTGRGEDASDRPGLQVNLPFSKQAGDIYVHWNAGLTWLHGVPLGSTARTNLTSPQIAASLIWNARPRLNLLVENVVEFEDAVRTNQATSRERVVTISPGFRGGWNLSEDKQIIVGAALPITFQEGERTVAFLTYFSYELPFTANR
jgi:hypothetical protein